ncbi:MAG: outer membrane beta-barrel protein [Hyphomonas sp.]|uniref:outer membrane beta-barrel protein n=1 Tax=Hyphomonas sp. TaxID=87 RepID=UPI0017B919C9|nr:outer membrane beta-barrel protein [Hyphomonas sp.]MBA3067512.1 outer membrane beta-barrel protein [Hyphomonas sp.]MBU3921387.1 outer membrane beta-barrel protein [Alphaproteobacteria bacterium]MBU4063400.1 outer membrane beta-barrel protein [Alphaproteobacteria bacterium]MBU4165221.1 outer membrane beta-barrel protein [Alphaproteobacteria bacterium]
MSKLKRMSLMSVAACALIGPVAFGQTDNYYSRDKYEAVKDRQQPEFDPEPVRLGAFVVRSNAEVGLTSNDNVFATNNNEESDIVARFGGEVAADTDWSVHGLGFDVTAYRNQYLDLNDESTTDVTGRLRGRLDVTRELSLRGSVFAEDRSEPRTDFVNAFGVDRPVEYTRKGVTADADYQNDRIRWNNGVSFADEDYSDGNATGTGTNIDQDYRDRSIVQGRSRLSYAVSPNLAVFAQATASQSDYDVEQIFGGLPRSRDSKGYTVSGGVDFELTSLIRGDIAVGYLNETKDDSFFSDVSGLSIDGRMAWFPTRLTTVNFDAARRVVDTGAFESPSAVETRFGVSVDHELRRNIVLTGYAGVSNYEYEETDRKDENLEFGAVATYKMNKRLHWEVFARNRERDVSGTGVFGDPSYGQTQFGIGLKLYP